MKSPKWRNLTVLLALAAVVLLSPAAALAFHVEVTDVYPNDNNVVTSFSTQGTGFAVFEDYNETFLKPYPSHDGFAVVNAQGNFFDKVLDFTESPPGTALGTFHIINTGPFTWSDYHFELWNADFTGPPTGVKIAEPFNSDDFKGFTLSADGLVLAFFNDGSPGSKDVPPGPAPANFRLTFELAEEGADISFGLRQVATTVPIPPTAVLMGSGLLGLSLLGYRRKKD